MISRLWREQVFSDSSSSVVHVDVTETKTAVESMDKDRLRFVLSPRRLKIAERQDIYYGLSERNQVLLVEPKDAQFDALANKDLVKWAKRVEAAEGLAPTSDPSRRTDYERIAKDDRKNITDAIRRAGLVYVRLDKVTQGSSETRFEEEALGSAASREDVIAKIRTEIYPADFILEHLRDREQSLRGQTAREIDREYRTMLGYPVPTHRASVFTALRELCKVGVIGLRHSAGDFCWENPNLTETELGLAVVDAPFEKPKAERTRAQPTGAGSSEGGGSVQQPTSGTTAGHTGLSGSIEYTEQEVRIPAQSGVSKLRQEVAARLQVLGEARVTTATFTVFLQANAGDLSTIPSAFRGTLSGAGDVMLELRITKHQVGDKGHVEQMIEHLPVIPNASYDARLQVLIRKVPDTEVEGA